MEESLATSLLETLRRFFTSTAPTAPGDLLVVAFSGGPDSTALLRGLAALAPRRGLRLLAAHLDHGLDPGSARRAAAAGRLAAGLGVGCVAERREVAALARPGESPEAAARRVRYGFLEELRRARGGRWIATAHHRDDQAETVLLRLLHGSGVAGLAGIQPVRGRVVRPLLELGRDELAAYLQAVDEPDSGDLLDPILDPTNRDLRIPRNRVRHCLLPALDAAEPGAAEALARLAAAAQGAREALDRRLEALLDPAALPPGPGAAGAAVRREVLEALPEALRPHALDLLERRAGAPYPSTRAAREELARQLTAKGVSRVGCDLPGGWRWESEGPFLKVFRSADHEGGIAGQHYRNSAEERHGEKAGDHHEKRGGSGPRAGTAARSAVVGTSEARPLPAAASTAAAARRASFAQGAPPAFSYTLPLPGEVEIPELGVTVRVRREPVAPWMFDGSPRRAALALPGAIEPGAERAVAVVRSRRPGDRLRPLGSPGTRKLKDVLIDRRVPRRERDRLPLLVVGGRIAWVPGVTVDEAFRLPAGPEPGGGKTWTVEVIP